MNKEKINNLEDMMWQAAFVEKLYIENDEDLFQKDVDSIFERIELSKQLDKDLKNKNEVRKTTKI